MGKLTAKTNGGAGVEDIIEIFELKINPNTDTRVNDGITSFRELKDYYKLSGYSGVSRQLCEKLKLLEEKLIQRYGINIDPIIYLMNLYYSEGLSTPKIAGKLEKMGINDMNARILSHLFKSILGWKIGIYNSPGIKQIFKTPKAKKRSINNLGKNHLSAKLITLGDYIDTIKNKVDRLTEFDKEKYNKLPNKIKKILYLLKFKYGISEEQLKKLHKPKKQKGKKNIQKIGGKVMAIFFQKKLFNFLKKENIILTIYPVDFDGILGVESIKNQKIKNSNRYKKSENEIEKKERLLQEEIIKYEILHFPDSKFSVETFNELPNKREKILYLLKYNFGIGTKQLLNIYKKSIGITIMSKIFNKELKSFLSSENIKLNIIPSNIYDILKETGKFKKIDDIKIALLKNILKKNKKSNLGTFDLDSFNTLDNNSKKFIYILEYLYGIGKNDLIEINTKQFVGEVIMKNVFEEELKSFLEKKNIKLNISPSLFTVILR